MRRCPLEAPCRTVHASYHPSIFRRVPQDPRVFRRDTLSRQFEVPEPERLRARFPLVVPNVPVGRNNSLVNHPLSLSARQFLPEACATWKGGRKGTALDFACKIEWDEWMQASALVRESDVVVEFGARFGTTSCLLSSLVGHKGAVVAVEPDYRVYGHFLRNLYDHKCTLVYPVLGTVSNDPIYMQDFGERANGYGATTSEEGGDGVEEIPHVGWRDVEAVLGKKINVALVDCEGCLPGVHKSGLLENVELVILEEDGGINYKDVWHNRLAEDFNCIWYLRDTSSPNKAWSRNMRHSSWLRKGSKREFPTCEVYRDKWGLNPETELVCDVCPILK